MSSWPERHGATALLAVAALALTTLTALTGAGAAAAQPYPAIGREATPREVAAWNIDVRPDFKGLPPGAGSVAQGTELWEAQCASCHGVFGESNQTFSPLVGGTTADDIRTGRVARLDDPAFPGRTTLMKVSTLSSLWDYIYRAMPWAAPKSLKVDEVYALTAYLLNLGGIVPDTFTLSNGNIAEVQQRLPNRDGITTDHGLWPGKGMGNGGKPDVKAVACMTGCAPAPQIASSLPDFARNAHGNLALQNRTVGAQRGADTTRPPPVTLADARASVAAAAPAVTATTATATAMATTTTTAATAPAGSAGASAALALTQQHACVTCHGQQQKIVGPSFHDIAQKYAGRADAVGYLTGKIRSGGSGLWGTVPMPAQTLSEADARTIAQWLAAGAAR